MLRFWGNGIQPLLNKKRNHMNNHIKLIEKLGQTSSIQQFDSTQQMLKAASIDNQAFIKLMAHSNDQICALFPDDDDEE